MAESIYDTQNVFLKNDIYDYQTFKQQAYTIANLYKECVKLEVVGYSHNGNELICLRVGNGKRRVHINGTHHANEWITSIVLMKSIEILLTCYEKDTILMQNNIRKLLDQEVTYDFVPMVNPDGTQLCLYGLEATCQRDLVLHANENKQDFSRWKANIVGIDLNRNYDAGFNAYQKVSPKTMPSYAYYSGKYPESEPETKAMVELTKKELYDMVLAYHTQGEMIYWDYQHINVKDALSYAKTFAKASGYILDTPDLFATGCGYKDWFISYFKKPGYTIECGTGENPISVDQVDEIVERTLPIIVLSGR